MEQFQVSKGNREAPERRTDAPRQISRRSFLKGVATLGAAKAISAIGVEKSEGGALEKKDVSERINKETEKAIKLIDNGDSSRFLESPYLVSALYYSDRFLKDLARGHGITDVSEEIIARISGKISLEVRELFMHMLEAQTRGGITREMAQKIVSPLDRFAYGRGENHPDAIDLFVEEGAEVCAMRAGVVALADRDWKKDDQFSVSSMKGGNSVIIYYPGAKEFYRYCHLRDISVRVWETIEAGRVIGTVGHSGINASKPGHGKHLHLEINRYDDGAREMRPLFADELRKKIEMLGSGIGSKRAIR